MSGGSEVGGAGGGGATEEEEKEEEEEPGVSEQKQKTHTKMWGTIGSAEIHMFRAEGLQPPSRISISALAKWCPAQLDREASNNNPSLARDGEIQPMDIHSAE